MSLDQRESIEPKIESDGENFIIDESVYIDDGVEYALAMGWVQPEEKDLLVEKYFRPIYRKYREVIEEVKKEIDSDPDEKKYFSRIVRLLGSVLKSTHRIGSTDPANIMRSIYECRSSFCKDTYSEYAITSLADFINDLLHEN